MRDMLEVREKDHSKTRLDRVHQCPFAKRNVLTVLVATGRRRETGVELVAAARIHRASTSPCKLSRRQHRQGCGDRKHNILPVPLYTRRR